MPVHFVDETQELEALYWSEHGSPPPLSSAETRRPDPPVVGQASDDLAPITDESSRDYREAQIAIPSPFSQPTSTPAASWKEARTAIPLPSTYSAIPAGSTLGLANFEHHHDVVFPFTQPHEVRLMKYYLEYMCTWFDLCDARRHFAIVVPRRAITCPTLLNAIFALSSRHLSLNGQYDPYASDRYHQECLKHLTAISNDSSALTNDDLLAATILLRTLEELDVPLIGTDHEGHLLGIQLFMNTQNASSTPPSPLRQASFWVGLRQEITMAFATQRPIKVKLDHLFIDRAFSPADDDCWANRIVVHCAEVVQFCFGEVMDRKSEYKRLVEYDFNWLRARPLSWLPIAYSEPGPSSSMVFPQIFYINHAVVIGNVHAALARALLMCHDESIPKIGPGRIMARKKLDDDIRMQIRELCGAALSNKSTIPAMITACMGVTACGDRFADHAEQRALLDILVKTDVEHSWPTASAQSHLKRAWGWEDDS
ncbi:ArcA-like protein [Colletotrichum tofieldiae]|uniref:ArcA-like protein n=1 Tax=Colletotrichum tofieldiae TaxID=708197 RepID=A0A166LLU3_9PEZI|nr:arcA-like protein [Colletotrichum tofieldiae]GKT63012.1 arcA-like protein [Colletotrichum tofieldiae]GKT72972.1 ArcA-like protein [Colletotrichum tofieldiae]GKT89179.1 arcA-like protein [Colletotrichum tofieldiae]